MKDQLLSKIHDHSATVAIIGLGYVGLPLAVALRRERPACRRHRRGPRQGGRPQRRPLHHQRHPQRAAGAGHSQFSILNSELSGLSATTDYSILTHCDAAIICVPTPLSKTRDPDVRYVIAAGESVAQHIHPGMLVALESTTYPGTTEELLLPILVGEGNKETSKQGDK